LREIGRITTDLVPAKPRLPHEMSACPSKNRPALDLDQRDLRFACASVIWALEGATLA
jgi:hypothetical protein